MDFVSEVDKLIKKENDLTIKMKFISGHVLPSGDIITRQYVNKYVRYLQKNKYTKDWYDGLTSPSEGVYIILLRFLSKQQKEMIEPLIVKELEKLGFDPSIVQQNK